jgi:hypothetical protein
MAEDECHAAPRKAESSKKKPLGKQESDHSQFFSLPFIVVASKSESTNL